MKMFRLLRPDEIECRVKKVATDENEGRGQKVTAKGVVLLLYKTARTDADLLDETVGAGRWQNDFKVVDGTLYGGIGIVYPEANGEWVWKWDAGTESNTEVEKGRASDAFKRAGFKWGIGRELYSAPFTFIPAGKCNIKSSERGGKTVFQCFDNFKVGAIEYDKDERISRLVITLKGERVFEWGGELEAPTAPKPNTDRVCSDCGEDIMMGVKKDGSVWRSEDIAAYSTKRYGRPLCVDCMKKVEYGT